MLGIAVDDLPLNIEFPPLFLIFQTSLESSPVKE